MPQRRRRSSVYSRSNPGLPHQSSSRVQIHFVASLTSCSSPPAASGPTTSGQVPNQPTSAPTHTSIPVKHQRPFSSGPKGYTTWYTTSSNQPISSPPATLPAAAGILYLHTDLNKGTNQIWLCNINCNWTDVTAKGNVTHPSIPDRILLLRSDGIPSWLTSANHAAVQSRKVRSGR
jgi:hypothetical protein